MRRFALAAVVAATLLGFAACRDEQGQARPLDGAVRSLASDAQEKLKDFGDGLEEAVQSGRQVARDVSDRVVEAADDAIDAADEAIESAEDAIGDS